MFLGEYHHNVDEKNRIIIPAKFRQDLGDKFIVTRGIERCLYAYSEENFERIVKKLEAIPFTKKDAREFVRFFLSGATVVEFDKQGRINITSPLVSYANIIKECTIIGAGERIEIWSENSWNEFIDSTNDSMSNIAENLFNDIPYI